MLYLSVGLSAMSEWQTVCGSGMETQR